jgi:hypothetical protein
MAATTMSSINAAERARTGRRTLDASSSRASRSAIEREVVCSIGRKSTIAPRKIAPQSTAICP